MNVREYVIQNRGKQVLAFDKKDIQRLIHFSDIAKNENTKGLIISGKYIGITDTYRVVALKGTINNLSGLDDTKVYPISILEKLKKAYSMIILKDGKLAIQIEDEAIEYDPISGEKGIDIASFIDSVKYENDLKANTTKRIIYNPIWRMLKLVDVSKTKSGFYFKNGKLIVKSYPNEDSVLSLEVLNFDNQEIDFETLLNIKYVDVWFRYIKEENFEIGLGANNRSPVSFNKDNLSYIILPVVSRK